MGKVCFPRTGGAASRCSTGGVWQSERIACQTRRCNRPLGPKRGSHREERLAQNTCPIRDHVGDRVCPCSVRTPFPVPDYGLILADLVVGIAAIVATIAASNFLADRVLDILTDNITRSRCSLVGKPSKDA